MIFKSFGRILGEKKLEGYAWSLQVGANGQNRTIVEPLTPFLLVATTPKGPFNEDTEFKVVGRIVDVRESASKSLVYCLVEEKEKKYAFKLSRSKFKLEEVNPANRKKEFKDAIDSRKRVRSFLIGLSLYYIKNFIS